MTVTGERSTTFTNHWDPRETEFATYPDAPPWRGPAEDAPVTKAFLGGRLAGPGGMYNLGNAIALFSGLAVQIAQRGTDTGPMAAVYAYLFGNPGATWLTVAMLIFFVGGEVYHRAWAGRAVPDQRLNRLGDLISSVGALAITAALVYFGDLLLALVAGTLLTGGKLGTALLPARPTALNHRMQQWLRGAVVLSRFPSLIALAATVVHIVLSSGTSPIEAVLPAIMMFCFGLWLWADLLLLKGAKAVDS
jgi:hypothetical protein